MEPGNATTAAESASITFVKRKSKGNVRKRALEDTDEPADPHAALAAAIAASGKRSKAVKGVNAFSTKKNDDDKLQTFKYSSSKMLQQQGDQGATAVLETETQHDRDARWAGSSNVLGNVNLQVCRSADSAVLNLQSFARASAAAGTGQHRRTS